MRKVVGLSIFMVTGAAFMLQGQLRPDTALKLKSPDLAERFSAFNQVAAKKNRSDEENTALVALLAREAAEIRQAFQAREPGKGEGYSEYLGRLTDEVVNIAEKEPNRTDVWPTLATCNHDGDSAFGEWMATHADKTAPFLKVCAKETNEIFRGQALTSLAQIVAYEHRPSNVHHLASSEVDAIEAIVRSGLSDDDAYVRMRGVMALAIMGTQKDIPILQHITETDPYVDPEVVAQGPQFDPYDVRFEARLAIKRLQARLKAQQ